MRNLLSLILAFTITLSAPKANYPDISSLLTITGATQSASAKSTIVANHIGSLGEKLPHLVWEYPRIALPIVIMAASTVVPWIP
jgi:hypothetical protein